VRSIVNGIDLLRSPFMFPSWAGASGESATLAVGTQGWAVETRPRARLHTDLAARQRGTPPEANAAPDWLPR